MVPTTMVSMKLPLLAVLLGQVLMLAAAYEFVALASRGLAGVQKPAVRTL